MSVRVQGCGPQVITALDLIVAVQDSPSGKPYLLAMLRSKIP
jgi:hypothetical protein